MRVGFIIDHPKRDLLCGIMLSHALSKFQLDTVIIPMYNQRVEVPFLELDVIIINYARPNNYDLVKLYEEMGILVWVLDTEGGVLADSKEGANNPEKLANYINASGYKHLISGYLFWGNNLLYGFRNFSGMDKRKLHLTGCPRFDYASNYWRELLKYDKKNYVLINTNFPLVNPLFATSNDEELQNLIRAGWPESYATKMMSDLRLIHEKFLDIISKLIVTLPDVIFLLRPHPFENSRLYYDRYQGISNLSIDPKGNVLNVIKNSSCLIHLNCGTSLEAILLGKVPISLEFINTSHMKQHSILPSQLSYSAKSFEHLVEAIRDIHNIESQYPFSELHDSYIKPALYLNDGKAAQRIAKIISDSITKSNTTQKYTIRNRYFLSIRSSNFIRACYSLMYLLIGASIMNKIIAFFDSKYRNKMFSLQEITDGLEEISRVEQSNIECVTQMTNPLTNLKFKSVMIKSNLSKTGYES